MVLFSSAWCSGDDWKGDSGGGQVLVEATRALFWWPLGALHIYFFFN
jgi:hypothetical protein